MDDMYVSIINLEDENNIKHTFKLPINREDFVEKLGLSSENGNYQIVEHSLPFDIGEFETIYQLNKIYSMVQDLIQRFPLEDLQNIKDELFYSIEEFHENRYKLIHAQEIDYPKQILEYYSLEQLTGFKYEPDPDEDYEEYLEYKYSMKKVLDELKRNSLQTKNGVYFLGQTALSYISIFKKDKNNERTKMYNPDDFFPDDLM